MSSLTPFSSLSACELVLEVLVLDAHGGRAEHVDQAAIAVVGEPGVAGLLGQALDARRRSGRG